MSAAAESTSSLQSEKSSGRVPWLCSQPAAGLVSDILLEVLSNADSGNARIRFHRCAVNAPLRMMLRQWALALEMLSRRRLRGDSTFRIRLCAFAGMNASSIRASATCCVCFVLLQAAAMCSLLCCRFDPFRQHLQAPHGLRDIKSNYVQLLRAELVSAFEIHCTARASREGS